MRTIGAVRRVGRRHAPFLHSGWMFAKRTVFRMRHRSTRARFTEIFRANHWRNPESASGFGSSLEATRDARTALTEIITDYSISSLLDIPCGDYNWLRHVPYDGLYWGADIVPDLVAANKARYANERRRFLVLDVTEDPLPRTDLVWCRDCLNHLSLSEGARALGNIVASGARYAVLTHYPNAAINRDQPSGFDYRPLNLQEAPFSWPPPARLWTESSEPGKTLALWPLDEISEG